MIKFGTSGFRGIIGDNWTKENIQKIGFAFRKVMEAQGEKITFIIGHDTRFLGRDSAIWFCEAACCESVHSIFMNTFVPTPYIAHKAVTQDFGIMITASHNPSIYNGIKMFLHGGKEAGDEFFSKIVAAFDKIKDFKAINFDKLIESGIVTFSENTDDYVDKIASSLDMKTIKASKPKILFNPMHGSSTVIMRKLFDKMGIDVKIINENPDPLFGGKLPAPYAHNLVDMAAMVVKDKYDCGVALDGDGDRIAVIDSDGKYYDCNYLSAALYYYLTQIKKQKGGAVKSFLSSNLIAKMCKKYGFDAIETPVGFKFLGKALEENKKMLLAMESSGMAFKQISHSKDAVTAAAFIFDLIASAKKSIGAIVNEVIASVDFQSSYLEFAYPFALADRETTLGKLLAKEKPKFDGVVKIDSYPDGFKIVFADDYWCAARISGTENAMRIYTEMRDAKACQKVIKIIEDFYGMTERQK